MSEEDKKLLLEMKHNCLKDNGTTNETYNDSKRINKAKAIDNVLQEIERLNNIINELESYSEKKITEYSEKIEELDNTDKISMLCVRSAYRDISNKIKMLKDSDK